MQRNDWLFGFLVGILVILIEVGYLVRFTYSAVSSPEESIPVTLAELR